MHSLIPFKEAKQQFERSYVRRLLKLVCGNMTEAAKIAEKDRKDFYVLTRRAGVDPQEFRPVPRKVQR